MSAIKINNNNNNILSTLIYSPLCECGCIHFGQLDGGLTHHLGVGDDALSDVLVSTRHHREA